MEESRRQTPGSGRPPKIPPSPGVASPPPVPSASGRTGPPALSTWPAGRRAKRAPPAPLLTPAELDRFKNLLVFARMTVEGFFAGRHRSPYRGSSVEFADYKEYVPGDDAHRIDWRAYGRTRRLFVRQYEAETDMAVYLLVDVSASMGYAGAGRQSKYLVAAKVAAALAYLMINQGDHAALGLFADQLEAYHPPRGTHRHLHGLIAELERVCPASTTGLAQALDECYPLFRKRGLIVLLSDFWVDRDEFFEALGRFLHRKFRVLLLHVMDPDELNLPAVNAVQFEDMESRERVPVEPEEIRVAYRRAAREHLRQFAREAGNRSVTHAVVTTDRPYVDAIEAYLGFRGNHGLVSRG